MFAGKRAVRRFSLLLLDEGENYVKDFVAHCKWPAEVPGNWQRAPKLSGQLRLCTKSLFFEPDDVRIPIARLPFAYLQGLEGGRDYSFTATALRVVRMKPGAADVPYAVDRDAATSWEFELAYAGLEEFMPLAQQMLLASRMQPAEQEEFVEAFLSQQEAGLRFDAAHLRSPALESLTLELPATSLMPLVREPGRVAVSDARLYFQPLHDVTGDAAVRSHPLPAVAAVARRRSSLRDIGVEVFFLEPSPDSDIGGPFWGAPSAFFVFKAREERDAFVGAVMGQRRLGSALPGGRHVAAACGSILEAEGSWLRRVTAAWQRGRVSNFEYLTFLNLAAGRSFNDLTQYPVFPWVLADYSSPTLDLDSPASFRDLSKPVGALNPVRLAMFQRRYAEMPAHESSDPPFLYGTHYSCPGYVMFWLVRAAPAHMLRLQNGRFDAPDRLFCSIKESWESVLANPTDVKELIPEFFMHRPDFLLNRHKLPLGSRQNGRAVGDVELPAWAGGSAEQFLEGQRAALEAPFVSANLHHWVDLIFGYQQRGAAAVDANNVFRHLTYEGAVDTEAVTNRLERLSLETQVNEFGQCPRQLFKTPHPPRLVCPPAAALGSGAATAGTAAAGGSAASTTTLGGVGGEGAGQGLSLALVSTLVAAASESEAPPPLEVPPLLLQLDVVRQREEQEQRELQQHGPIVSRATIIVEDFGPGRPNGSNGGGNGGGPLARSVSAVAAAAAPSAAAAMAAAKAASPYTRLRSWAHESKLGERLGAIKGALGDAVGAPPGERASAIRGLFKRGAGAGSSGSLASQQQVQGGDEGEDSEIRPSSRAASASAAESQARPVSPTGSGGLRVSSFTAGLSQRFQSLTSTLASSAPASAAAQPGHAAGQAAGERGEAVDPVAAGQDVMSGLMRWKYSSRQPMPAESSSDEEEGGPEGPGEGGASAAAALAVPHAQPGLASPRAAQAADAAAQAAADPLPPSSSSSSGGGGGQESLRLQLLEAQRLRMLRERAASPPGSSSGGGEDAAALGGRPYSSASSPRRGWRWGAGLRDRLGPGRVFAAGGEAINSVALGESGGTQAVYCAGHGGALKLYDLVTGDQLRSAQICSQPVTSLALLPTPGSSGSGSGGAFPLALCGSYDAHLYAYSVELGRVTGSFQAHNDTVSCLAWLGDSAAVVAAGQQQPDSGGGGGRLRLATGSWDASVRVWDLGEGRQPWGSKPPSGAGIVAGSAGLLCTLGDLPGGVWALAPSADGDLLLAGLEDGHVTLWDVRSGTKAWEQPASQDYIGGLRLTPDGLFVVVAAADGCLSLLDMRRGGMQLSSVACGPPLRCCETDGDLAVAGAEDGMVHVWDVAQQRGRVASSCAFTPPGPDGLYEPLRSSPPSPINALAMGWPVAGDGGGQRGGLARGPILRLVTGHEGGLVRSYEARPQ